MMLPCCPTSVKDYCAMCTDESASLCTVCTELESDADLTQVMTMAWWTARTKRKECEAEREQSADTLTDAAIDAAMSVSTRTCSVLAGLLARRNIVSH